MKKYLLFVLLHFLAGSILAQPPNNTIFFGGAGDGASGLGYLVAANTIYAGGSGDGVGIGSNNATSNNVFLGGAGDGFASQSNNVISNNIFAGSAGDGFHSAQNVSLPNNIYKGGAGDGWHAVIFPMSPLPVKLLSFTAEHAGKAHLIRWITAEEINTKYFEVQRSANGSQFETAGIVQPSGTASDAASYRHTVNEPWEGNNFYRLKIVDTDGSIRYSNTVLLKNEGMLQLSVYPNPAAQQLFIKIPVINAITTSMKAFITDAAGKTVMQVVLKTGTTNSIDIEKLANGMYTIQCDINNYLFVLRFLKTN